MNCYSLSLRRKLMAIPTHVELTATDELIILNTAIARIQLYDH